MDLDGGPQSFNFLVRALLNNSGKLQLLPGGEATIRKVKSLPVDAGGKKVNATLYAVDGLYFTPAYIWLDDTNNVLAAVGGWSGMVREGFEGSIGALIDEQEQAQSARAGGMAKQLIHHPSGDLVIKNVTVFDSVNANKVRGQRVTVREERIVSVEARVRSAHRCGSASHRWNRQDAAARSVGHASAFLSRPRGFRYRLGHHDSARFGQLD